MKKTILGMAVLALFFTGCNDDNDSLEEEQAKVDMSDFYLYTNPSEDGTTTCAPSRSRVKLSINNWCHEINICICTKSLKLRTYIIKISIVKVRI